MRRVRSVLRPGVLAMAISAVHGCLAAAGSLASAQTGPRSLTVDPESSRVVINVGKAGFFGFAGHPHEVVARGVRGRVAFDQSDPARSSVALEFDAARLEVTGAGEPAEDVPEVQRIMLSERVLDVERHPVIRFVSHEVHVESAAQDSVALTVFGELTIRGVTRPVSSRVVAGVGPGGIAVRGAVEIKQTDFGIEPVTAALGTVRTRDELEVTFLVTARPGAPPGHH